MYSQGSKMYFISDLFRCNKEGLLSGSSIIVDWTTQTIEILDKEGCKKTVWLFVLLFVFCLLCSTADYITNDSHGKSSASQPSVPKPHGSPLEYFTLMVEATNME